MRARDKNFRCLLVLFLVLLPIMNAFAFAAAPAHFEMGAPFAAEPAAEPGLEAMEFVTMEPLEPQTAARNNFAGATTVHADNTTTASGTVTVKCNGVTCPAGVYRIDVAAEVRSANTTQTSPNLSALVGWTGATGALTQSVIKPDGTTTANTAVTGTKFWGSVIVKTTGALSIAWSLSGSTGSQAFDWTYTATRIQ